jgi:hypothetical protein
MIKTFSIEILILSRWKMLRYAECHVDCFERFNILIERSINVRNGFRSHDYRRLTNLVVSLKETRLRNEVK